MNVAFFSYMHITYLAPSLNELTLPLANGHSAICLFVNDNADAMVIQALSRMGVKVISLRCAGTNNVDLVATERFGIKVVHVPSYSPHAVAEFTIGLLLTVVRKYHKAFNRTREGNFSLSGLVGFNLNEKTVGLVGTGRIGLLTAKILSQGFGRRVLAYDPFPNEPLATEYGIKYRTLEQVLANSDIISLHCPLSPSSHHLLNGKTVALTKPGVVIINTSRGGLIDTKALIRYLKSGHIGALGMDVYEHEAEYFFHDSSGKIIDDDDLSRLMSFYNVFISGHQAFLSQEALEAIAETSVNNILALIKDGETVVRTLE
ncbi:hypothetical protein V500_01430 [Pseudogymnoascus sp. VKM F-4518 (FW-2643)]|nr:hypothetical protein V500_01430 [Pseudogymnoascus sp. VKM F-4518 (FW-2643)]